MRCLAMGVFLAFLWSASSGQALSITPNGASLLSTSAGDDPIGFAADQLRPSTLPVFSTSSVEERGNTASTGYDLSGSGFRIDFNHYHTGVYNSLAQSSGRLHFGVASVSPFEMSGFYRRVGEGVSRYRMNVQVFDRTAGQMVFRYRYTSTGDAPSFDLVLGASGYGSGQEVGEGLLAGQFLPGHRYELSYSAYVAVPGSRYPDALGQAGQGRFNLRVVPEPSASVLLGLGLALLTANRSRRTRGVPG